jgi:hypothetical protein
MGSPGKSWKVLESPGKFWGSPGEVLGASEITENPSLSLTVLLLLTIKFVTVCYVLILSDKHNLSIR